MLKNNTWDQFVNFLLERYEEVIITALLIAMFVITLIWISTEIRLRVATRTKTIIDHRHSTPHTVDVIITNPLNMKSYHGSFFDPLELHLTHGPENEEFDVEYMGRMDNNYKFRIKKLKPSTSYTNVKIRMGETTFMKQPFVNIWTRDKEDKIISISETTPNDKTIDSITVKSKNRIQRNINEQYFKYALHYGNSKTRWIDVENKIVSKTIKKVEKTTETKLDKTTAKKTTAKKTTSKTTKKK